MRRLFALAVMLAGPAAAGDLKTCAHVSGEQPFGDCVRKLDARDLAAMRALGAKIKQQGEGAAFAKVYDAADRAWLAYRDRECEAKTFESRTGSGFGSIFAACLVEMNERRLVELKERADSP